MQIIRPAGRLFYILVFLTLTACGGGGGGGGNNQSGGSNSGGGEDNETPAPVEPMVTFSLNDAAAVLVYDDPIDLDGTAAAQGRWQPQGLVSAAAADEGKPANLLTLGKDGRLRIAFSTRAAGNDPEISYTVPSPDNRYLYVAMQTGAVVNQLPGSDPRSSGYCYLFKVDVATNEWSCLPVVPFANDEEPDYVSFGQAVQFDGQGRTYIAGCTRREGEYDYESVWCYGYSDEWDKFALYLETEDGALEPLNVFQNDESVQSIHVTKSGDVLYQAYKEGGSDELKLWRRQGDAGKVRLVSSNPGSLSYHIDDSSTIYHRVNTNSEDFPVPLFMRPNAGDELKFDRLLLGPRPSYDLTESTYRRYLFTSGDGRLFVFTPTYNGSVEPPYNDYLWQLLPRPKLISVDREFSRSARFVANRVIRVVKKDTGDYGEIKYLSLVSLENGEEARLFDVAAEDIQAGSPFYNIYTLAFDGHLAYFSALDLSRTINVVGVLDLDAFNGAVASGEKDKRADEYLEIIDVGSATDASSQLRDIKALKTPSSGSGEPPIVESIDFYPDNPYSVSISFSKPMDQASVEEHLTLMSKDGSLVVPYMPLWLGNRLHLLVDLNGFANGSLDNGLPDTTPLKSGETYVVEINNGATDRFGNPLVNQPEELKEEVKIE